MSFFALLVWLRRGHTERISQILLNVLFLSLLPFYGVSENLSLLAVEYIALLAGASFLVDVRSVTRFGLACMGTFGIGLIFRAQNFPGIVPFSQRALWEGSIILMIMGIILYILRVALTSMRDSLTRTKHSEARYRALLDAVPDLIFRMNGAGIFVDYQVNRQQMLFLPPEAFLGKPVTEVIPSLTEKAHEVIKNTLQSGNLQTVEYQLQLTGDPRHFEARLIKTGADEITAIIRDIPDRKHAEAERAQQENRLKAYLSASPVAIYLLDLQTRKSFYFNRESFCGYSKTDLETPGSIQFATHPDDREMINEHWGKIFAGTSEKSSLVYRLQNKSGEWEWIDETKSVTGYDAAGKPKEVLVTLSIITEHKLAEERIQQLNAELEKRVVERTAQLAASNAALREVERRYQTVTDLISEYAFASYIDEQDQSVIDWLTPSVEKVTGYSPQEFQELGGWSNILYPEDKPKDDGYRWRLLAGESISGEVRIINRDASIRWVRTTVRPEMDETGKVIRLLGIITDITEIKHAEIALRENEAKLRTLFELLPVGVSVLTPERQLIEMNETLERILGMDREGLLRGQTARRSYLRADGSPMPLHELASLRALTEHRPIYNVETGVVVEDSRIVWTNVNAAPLPDEGVVVVTADITERKQAERRRAILYETLHRIGIFLTPEEVLQTAVDAIAQLSHWKSVAISRPNPDGNTWKTHAGAGELVGTFGKNRAMNEGIIGRVYMTGQSQFIPDVSLDQDYFRGDGQPAQTRCEIAVALKHRGQILGV
ncbi:MAG TPA: PAS domain S-box protein, partial [Anaerolineales bacterium]|nr:PAS domain S-box protein [Anaerolineales bacterium]